MATGFIVLLALFGSAAGQESQAEKRQGEVRIALASGGSMVSHGETETARHNQPSKQAQVRKHSQGLLQKLVSEETTTTYAYKLQDVNKEKRNVSCGAHMATRCRFCTVIDPETEAEIEDQGPSWCHGECTYYDGECHAMTAHNMKRERDEHKEDATTSKPIPDLLDPEISDNDKEIMEEAARRGLEEEDFESKQQLANEAARREKEKDQLNKFIYFLIMALACSLTVCACVSVVWCCCGHGISNHDADVRKRARDYEDGYAGTADDIVGGY